jgi:hypothetical protein
MTPDEMIAKLLDPSSDEDKGALVNDLSSAFSRGYPIENLRRLLDDLAQPDRKSTRKGPADIRRPLACN